MGQQYFLDLEVVLYKYKYKNYIIAGIIYVFKVLHLFSFTPFYISNADFYIVLNHIKNICNYFFIIIFL